MNVEFRQPARAQNAQAKARLEIVDVDIHPKNTLEDFRPYLSNRWWDYLQTYGRRSRHGFVDGYPFPKMTPIARRRAGDRNFVQVLMLSRTAEALGRKRYWPIYEAAVEAGLPVGIHAFGYSGWAMTNGGWPSFYIEEATEHATSAQTVVTSMVMEGLFERYRDLKVIMIECGFGWLPALGWRLDKLWRKMRDEVPHLRRPPSEYIREHFYVSTQPMEEPEDPRHVLDAMRWIGFDRILFASDYPHWDFDDPVMAIPPSLAEEQRRMIFAGNARTVYRLD